MHRRLVVLVGLVASWTWPAVAQRAFPYKASIAANDTYVRAGPGETYYPTGKLNAGAQVEVYRHDHGGWYAIRPPEGSFSWIGGRYVRPTGDGLAEVTGERVAVRVGSNLTDRRDVVQIHVRRGEIVELLGTQQSGTGSSAATWCKISPPSGEFRWVHGNDVDLGLLRDGAAKTAAERSPPAETAKPKEPPSLAPAGTTSAPKWTPSPAGAPLSSSSAVATAAASPVASTPSGQQTPTAPPAAAAQRSPGDEFQKVLDDINTELAIMLAEEPSTWNCEDLSRRARALLDRAQTALDRGHARMLANRIALADDVRRRQLAANAGAPETARRGPPVAASSRGWDATGPSPAGQERFDGVGRLTRVHLPKLGAPRYALVDAQGNVKAYVSPAPGVSMQPYVGREVGIHGTRGYIAEQHAEHVTARHITMLDNRVR